MRQQVKNINFQPEPDRRIGEVISKTGQNARVKDAYDRIWIAEINRDVPVIVGDTVIIRAGVIISTTSIQAPAIVFEV